MGTASRTVPPLMINYYADYALAQDTAQRHIYLHCVRGLDDSDVGSRKVSKILTESSIEKGSGPLSRSKIHCSLETSRTQKLREVGRRCTAVFCDGRNDKCRSQTPGRHASQGHLYRAFQLQRPAHRRSGS